MTKQGADERLRSLRIDPNRRLPSRGTGAVLFLAVGLALGLGSAATYHVYRSPGPGAAPVPRAAAGSSTTPSTSTVAPPTKKPAAAPSPGSVLLAASGYVTPRNRVSLSPKVIGIVSWVGIEKGDSVNSGDTLVRLENEDYSALVRQSEATLQAAKARLAELEAGSRNEDIARARALVREQEAALANAESRLRRAQELVFTRVESDQVVEDAEMTREMAAARLEQSRQALALAEAGARKEQIDAARAEVAALEASLEYARIQLEDTVIRAPLDGTILEKLIEVGELVSPQNFGGTRGARTELLSMADLSDLQVEVDINENDFAKIKMAQPARVTLDAYPDRSYDGRVREIAPEADRAKATVQVKVEILNPDGFIKPEMGARVDLLAEPSQPASQAAPIPPSPTAKP